MRHDAISALQIRDEQADLAGHGPRPARSQGDRRSQGQGRRATGCLGGAARHSPGGDRHADHGREGPGGGRGPGYLRPGGGRSWRRKRGRSWKPATRSMRRGPTRPRAPGTSRARRRRNLSGAGTRCRSGRRKKSSPRRTQPEADEPEVEVPEPEASEPEASEARGTRAGSPRRARAWRGLAWHGQFVHLPLSGDASDNRAILACPPRCRIKPYLDQGGAARGGAGPASAPGLCLGRPRPGARRATRSRARRPKRLNRQLPGVATNPSSSGSGWPAGVHRVRALPEVALYAVGFAEPATHASGRWPPGRLSPE